MSVFDEVRAVKPETGDDEERLRVARALLLTEIHEDGQTARHRAHRQPWLIAGGLLGAAAASTAAILVLNGMTAPTPVVEAVPTRSPGASLIPTPAPTAETAPQVLQGAAAAARNSAASDLSAGQYLRIDWTVELLALYDPAPASGGWAEPGWGVARSAATSAWLIRWSGTQYAPSDLTGEWYGEWRAPEAGELFGDRSQAQTEVPSSLQDFGPSVSLHPLGGAPTLPEDDGTSVAWYLERMPREPEALITWLRELIGPGKDQWVDGMIGLRLVRLLSTNVGDPELRSAMYLALSLLPGASVTDEMNGNRTVTFDARLAGADPAATSVSRFAVTMQMSTGLVTETTSTSEVGQSVIPSEVPDMRTSYTVSVVDSLP